MIQIDIEPNRLIVGQPNKVTLSIINTSHKEVISNLVFRLDMPTNFTLLKGKSKIELSHIQPGKKHTEVLELLPKSIGKFLITSTNYSYRDGSGKACRIKNFCYELQVTGSLSKIPTKAPVIIRLDPIKLFLNQDVFLKGEISNIESEDIRNITIAVDGPLKCITNVKIGLLLNGYPVRFSIKICPLVIGSQVPAFFVVSYSNSTGQTISFKLPTSLQVVKPMASSDRTIHLHNSTYVESTETFTQNNYASSSDSVEVIKIVKQHLEKILSRNPSDLEIEIQQEIKYNPKFRNCLRNALKEGGIEALKVIFPPLGIAVATLRGWLDTN